MRPLRPPPAVTVDVKPRQARPKVYVPNPTLPDWHPRLDLSVGLAQVERKWSTRLGVRPPQTVGQVTAWPNLKALTVTNCPSVLVAQAKT